MQINSQIVQLRTIISLGTVDYDKNVKKSNNNKIFAGIFVLFFSLLCNLVTAAGSAHTEGDYVLKTDQLRNLTNADGAGVIVGVVSSGVKGLADAQRSGDLPDSLVILKEGKKLKELQ